MPPEGGAPIAAVPDEAAPAPPPPLDHENLTFSIDDLLEVVVHRRASDLHLTSGSAPAIRITTARSSASRSSESSQAM